LAEGYSKKSRQEYIQFVRIAFGSSAELETQLLLTKDLELAPQDETDRVYNKLEEVMKMPNKLLSSLQPKP
jgi:four helix bundle protein